MKKVNLLPCPLDIFCFLTYCGMSCMMMYMEPQFKIGMALTTILSIGMYLAFKCMNSYQDYEILDDGISIIYQNNCDIKGKIVTIKGSKPILIWRDEKENTFVWAHEYNVIFNGEKGENKEGTIIISQKEIRIHLSDEVSFSAEIGEHVSILK